MRPSYMLIRRLLGRSLIGVDRVWLNSHLYHGHHIVISRDGKDYQMNSYNKEGKLMYTETVCISRWDWRYHASELLKCINLFVWIAVFWIVIDLWWYSAMEVNRKRQA